MLPQLALPQIEALQLGVESVIRYGEVEADDSFFGRAAKASAVSGVTEKELVFGILGAVARFRGGDLTLVV